MDTIGEIVRRFRAYEKVRQSGKYNMITDAGAAMDESGLTEGEYFAVVENYGHYKAVTEAWEKAKNDKDRA